MPRSVGVIEPLRVKPDTGVPVRSTTVAVTTAVAPLWAMRVPGTISSVIVCGTPAFNDREAIDEGRYNEAPCTTGEAAGIMLSNTATNRNTLNTTAILKKRD